MSKIYCSIYNGLGNQLFGYALGLYLSKKHNKELVIDLTKLNTINFLSRLGLKKDTIREFELDKIGFTDPVIHLNFKNIFKKISFLNKKKILYADFRKSHHELELIDTIDIYCIGWGDFNLVKEVLPELRAKFSPNFEITRNFETAKNIILENNSVAIHFRRTDFLDPKVNNYSIGICSDQYYVNAIQMIKEQMDDTYFIIFSDDVEYVKEKFKIDNCYFVEGNTGYEDLYLMSLCKHFILANSTFSFWAAILNTYQNRIVCVPEYWYNSPYRQADFIPDEWNQIAIN